MGTRRAEIGKMKFILLAYLSKKTKKNKKNQKQKQVRYTHAWSSNSRSIFFHSVGKWIPDSL